ncbi:adaptive-response sensory-kinase SasA [Rhodoferax lithotrophicus]|uniref:histidine kinase n=1 Tax=Rhodoferax lithotrophicus TaxID=2798804 RepID=A0ABM7MTJ6_9BURK|nr:ATP-binding protein [Rhodoferax sp. MIZ03]BCO29697.1 adaptive-response sensory-kinase SasA [Rhodoferax sp. MIZ03]
MELPRPPDLMSVPRPLDGLDDGAWLDVIQKMDEVYSRLLADEVALEQKNAQLEASQQLVYSLLSSMSDVLVAADAQGQIEQTNQALCELVGSTDAALMGVPMHSLLYHGQGADLLQGMMQRTTHLRQGDTVELMLRDRAGQSVPVDFTVTPRYDGRRRCVGYVFVGRPMAEIKRAYRQLHEAHEALKRTQQQLLHAEKMSSLGRLVAGVAHELNNPISFVLGNVHVLNRYTTRLRQYLDAVHAEAALSHNPELMVLAQKLRIEPILRDLPSLMDGTIEGAQRTASIVDGLKRFSALDGEEREVVDVNAVIERAIHWVRTGMKLDFDVELQACPGCVVLGNAGQLLQVLMNLIQNAYDAASALPDVTPVLKIKARREACWLEIQLHDNGPGIAPEAMSSIFEPFFTTKPVGKGTGLGLSISYGIVERHAGTLTAHNHPQGGAEFVLRLPAVQK